MLVTEIEARRRKLEEVHIEGNVITLKESRIRIECSSDWHFLNCSIFERFKHFHFSDTFSKLEEKDKQNIKDAIYPPQFILHHVKADGPNSFALGYLFTKAVLVGASYLSLRSLIKMEQMWSGHLLKFVDSPRTKPQSLVISSYLSCISEERIFQTGNDNMRGLRILMVEVDEFVLTLYLIEPHVAEKTQSAVERLIKMISLKRF